MLGDKSINGADLFLFPTTASSLHESNPVELKPHDGPSSSSRQARYFQVDLQAGYLQGKGLVLYWEGLGFARG